MSRNRLPLLALLIALPTFAQKSRPNLVFFLSDDHRWDYQGCAGHGILKTPVLDELAHTIPSPAISSRKSRMNTSTTSWSTPLN